MACLVRREAPTGVAVWIDPDLAKAGVLVAFSERVGGSSESPYDALNLAAHVGDEQHAVDGNRDALFDALGIPALRQRLVTAEQVHGERVYEVLAHDAGAGAYTRGRPPVAGTDALMTGVPGIPLLLLYADCVPVVLVAPPPNAAVCVVHAGWRGALAGLAGRAAQSLGKLSGRPMSELSAYLGAHIGACCYEVSEDLLSHFRNAFDTIGAVDGGLDLAAAVRQSLTQAGLCETGIAELGVCTRDHTDRFFSYRAAPITGRHGALAVITKGEYDEPAPSAEQLQSI